MSQHREKRVFLVAGTTIGVLVPSILMAVAIVWIDPVPDFVYHVLHRICGNH